MSDTDKTRPFWVRVEDPHNRRYVEERHDHRKGVCDFDGTADRWGNVRRCALWPKSGYAGFGEFYATGCDRACWICNPDQSAEGTRRMRWRQLSRNLLKTALVDVDDMEDLTTCARPLRRSTTYASLAGRGNR